MTEFLAAYETMRRLQKEFSSKGRNLSGLERDQMLLKVKEAERTCDALAKTLLESSRRGQGLLF